MASIKKLLQSAPRMRNTLPQNVTRGNGVKNPQKAEAYVGKRVLRNGDTIPAVKGSISPVPNGPLVKKKGVFKGSTLKKGGKVVKKALLGTGIFKNNPITKMTTDLRGKIGNAQGIPGKPIAKKGGLIKRADGSYSKRGLWDNIRANKGSGKKPTAAMLKQERKIKSKK